MPAPTALRKDPTEDILSPAPQAIYPSAQADHKDDDDDEVLLDATALNPTLEPGALQPESGTGAPADVEMEVDEESRPRFAPIKDKAAAVRIETRKIPIPPHRMSPLKSNWAKIYPPLVEHLKLQVRMNVKSRTVEVRNSRHTTDSSGGGGGGALQKGADFVKAFTLGFDVDDAIALLRLDDLYIETFEIKDVKTLTGDHLARAIGRIAGKDGKTKFAIENASKTRVVLADSKIHILGGFKNINIAREAIVSLILGKQIYRFSVTGNSFAGPFTLLQTNAPTSKSLGVLPHLHRRHCENFYCTKGRMQLWAAGPGVGADQQTRVMTQGDYGAVPPLTSHTFQVLDPAYDSDIGSPFIPANLSAAASGSPALISSLERLDVYARLDFAPRDDLSVTGAAGGGASGTAHKWHNGSNELAADAESANCIAKNHGPKRLHLRHGVYSIITPLVTGRQSDNNFTMGTITLSPVLHGSNRTAPPPPVLTATAFQLEEGELIVRVDGFREPARLIQGDVVFVPAGVRFSYHTSVPFTKFLYVSGVATGLDYELLQESVEWEYASYPQNIAVDDDCDDGTPIR